jgi:transposase
LNYLVASTIYEGMKQDGRQYDPKTQEAIRMMAMKRIQGEDVASVMDSFGLCRTTGYKWKKKICGRGKGIRMLAARKGSGRPPKLTPGQQAQVFRWINGKNPQQYGFDFGLWTRQVVCELIAQKFQVKLSLASIGTLLANQGLTAQKPLQRAYQRDPQAIDRWQSETFPEIAQQARQDNADVYFWDESGFRADAVHGKTWGVKGQTPVVERPGQRQSISAASAVNSKGGFWFATYEGGLTGELFVDLLKKLMHRRKKPVRLVVDGLPAHKKACVKEYVASTQGKLSLHFLPGYAPDLNPDELVWSHAKRTGVARNPLKAGEKLKDRVDQQLQAIADNPPLVRAFFKHPSVAYISDL